MGIHVQFNTDDLTSEDIAVLNALARSLADPNWATEEEPPKRRTTRRAPAKAAPKTEEKAEEPAPKPTPEEPKAEEPAPEPTPEEPKAEEPKKAPAKAETPKVEEKAPEPAPEPEEAPEAPADEDDEAEAVRLATALVHDGRGAEVRSALKAVDAKKVSDLKGESLSGFLAAVREL